MKLGNILELFGEMVKWLLSQVTGLFTSITGDPLLYAIVLIVAGLSICGTVIALLRRLGLRSRKGKRKGRR